jgi:hypothetical protein
MRAFCAAPNAFANGREHLFSIGGYELQLRERISRRARRAITGFSNLFQRGNDKFESRLDHCV